jgi:hypothetical protein
MKADRRQQGSGVSRFTDETFGHAVAVPKQTRIGRVMNVAFGDGCIGTNMFDIDVAFVFHLNAEEFVAGLPGFRLDGVKGFTEQCVVDGLLFEESAKVLEKHGIGDTDGCFAERPSFTLHEEECADGIFGRKVARRWAWIGGVDRFGCILRDIGLQFWVFGRLRTSRT